jgi:preprotein translocase SecE subunit
VAVPDQKTSKKPKRRLKTAPVTMRELAEKSAQNTPEAKARPNADKSRRDKSSKPKRALLLPLRAVWRPINWLGRHIIPRYFKTAFQELRLTTWPSRKQSRQLTMAVVLFAIIFGTFVSVLDYGLNKLFKELFVK